MGLLLPIKSTRNTRSCKPPGRIVECRAGYARTRLVDERERKALRATRTRGGDKRPIRTLRKLPIRRARIFTDGAWRADANRLELLARVGMLDRG
ncbi:hypothetical protein PIIN_03799 [Serendipita indica DSM 11827]|uniref:Uncharacterized protein n=1 Tax=Serendipita indica (strain DSM 11827) TaxID=1109443 RepID=G4TEW7_SERID|nr:hypothetical protein PIIN_03799 [Serendipita indica DSM 11827]